MGKDPSLEHPWQKSPTQLIQYAEELMNEEDDFENQLAFLLTDVGVESILITYLSLPIDVTGAKTSHSKRKASIEKESFHELITGVKDAAGKLPNDIDFNQVLYFHNIRNKLYHHGDGIVATDENLNAYLELAKLLLRNLLKVDLIKESEDFLETFMERARVLSSKNAILDSIANVKNALVELKTDAAIAVSQSNPEWTKRSFKRRLKEIWNENPDEEFAPLWHRTENQENRIRHFNELFGRKIEDTWFIDEVLQDITYLFIQLVSNKMARDPEDDKDKYYEARIFLKNNRNPNLEESDEIISKSEKIINWVESFQDEIEKTFWEN